MTTLTTLYDVTKCVTSPTRILPASVQYLQQLAIPAQKENVALMTSLLYLNKKPHTNKSVGVMINWGDGEVEREDGGEKEITEKGKRNGMG